VNLFISFRQRLGFDAVLKAKKSNRRIKKYLQIGEARHIAILYEWSGTHYHRLMQIIKSDVFKAADIELVGYLPVKPAKHENPGMGVFTANDVDWKMLPKPLPVISQFLKKEYDIVFDISLNDHIPLMYLMANAKSKLTVSLFSGRKKQVADILIHLNDQNAEMEIVLKHMTHYLQQIQSTTS